MRSSQLLEMRLTCDQLQLPKLTLIEEKMTTSDVCLRVRASLGVLGFFPFLSVTHSGQNQTGTTKNLSQISVGGLGILIVVKSEPRIRSKRNKKFR